jgi:zinc protease
MKLRVLLSMMLAAGLSPADGVEVEGLPKPAEPRAAKLISPQEKTLENGLRVIVVERPSLPLLSAALILQTGSEADPPKLAGLAHFTAQLLTKGTPTRTAPEIAQQIETLGASLTSEANFDAMTLGLTTLSANAGAAFEILGDVVRHPKFAPEEIERLRRQTLDDLRLEMEQPGAVARAVAARAILGSAPYAHPAGGTLTSLPRIKRADLVALHVRAAAPANALLVMAGNVTAEEGFALAEKALGDWSGEKLSVPKPAPAAPTKPRAILIDLPNAGQAAVYIGKLGIVRTDDALPTGEVANCILGLGYSSRLNQEIRIKRGLSYGVRSRLTSWRTTGLFTAGCQTKNESAAEVVSVIQTELQRLASEAVDSDYLAARQAVVRGEFARDLETNEGYVRRVADLALYGLPLEKLAHHLETIDGVTAEAARDFAQKHLSPEGLSVIVAGRAKDVAEPLRKLFPKLEIIPQKKLDLDSPTLAPAKK